MASEAQIKQKILDEELKKPVPNSDLVYTLQKTRDYWNTIDTDKMKRGSDLLREKLKNLNNANV